MRSARDLVWPRYRSCMRGRDCRADRRPSGRVVGLRGRVSSGPPGIARRSRHRWVRAFREAIAESRRMRLARWGAMSVEWGGAMRLVWRLAFRVPRAAGSVIGRRARCLGRGAHGEPKGADRDSLDRVRRRDYLLGDAAAGATYCSSERWIVRAVAPRRDRANRKVVETKRDATEVKVLRNLWTIDLTANSGIGHRTRAYAREAPRSTPKSTPKGQGCAWRHYDRAM